MKQLTDHEKSTHKALRYSAIPELTVGGMREWESDSMRELIASETIQSRISYWYEYCQTHHISYAHQWQEHYPYVLHPIMSSPYVMHWMGDISLLYRKSIALVWPRKATPYAHEVMTALFDILPDYDVVTISWLADGVDTMAHTMSLDKKIPTIAVLGWGMAHFLASGRREFIRRIIDNGWLVLSEFKLDMQPTNWSFPQRNRLVAGLSTCVFVPEASLGSGSLITVDYAQQMHRPVYGAPQSIFASTSAGLLSYMQQWLIKPVIDFRQMLALYFEKHLGAWWQESLFWPSGHQDRSWLSDLQTKILQSIMDAGGETNLHGLQSTLGLDTASLMSELMMLEVVGRVSQSGEKVRVKR